MGSGRTRRSGKNQIGKKLAEPAAGSLEFKIARGPVQPSKIHKQRNFSPGFGGFRRKTDVAQNTRHVGGAFFLDAADARTHSFIAASPRAQRRFPPRARKIGAMFDEARPTRGGVRSDDRIVEPRGFVAFPAVQHLREQLLAILKMPVEAALAHAEIAREQFDAHGFNSLGGKAREGSTNPIIGLQRRRLESGCSSHVVFYACRETIPECIERVKLRDCYDYLGLCDGEGRGENFRHVAEACEPVHAGFFAEPGELTLGEATRGLLDLLHGVFFAEAAGEMFAQLRITDELEWLRVGRDAACDERANFCEPSGGEHRIRARVDACVERGARRQQADFDYFIPMQGVAAAAMDFAHWFSGEQPQFERANYFLCVARGNARGRFCVQTRERAMQMFGAAELDPLPQARANFFRALRSICESFEESAQIQSGPCGENWQSFATAKIVEDFQRASAVISRSKNLRRLDEIHQMMRNAALFGDRDFRRADIEMAIHLRGIADQYFAAKSFRELNSQRGFAGSGGTQYNDEPRQRAHPENFQYRSSRPSNTSAARRRTPIICVRLSFMESPVDTLSPRGGFVEGGMRGGLGGEGWNLKSPQMNADEHR